jgi:hypothetical protein
VKNGSVVWNWGGNIDLMINIAIFINSSISNSTEFSQNQRDVLKSFYENFHGSDLYRNLTANYSLLHAGSDWFYLPSSKFQSFHFMSRLFREFDVFLEVAVTYLLLGLDTEKSIVSVQGRYDWNGIFLNFKTDYEKVFGYFHPFKLSWLKSNTTDTKEQGANYCRYYVQEKYASF